MPFVLSIVCPLQYTLVANNRKGLYLCKPCPPGSRRLSHATEECVCDLDYYPIILSDIQECCRCPPGSSRLTFNDTKCTCNLDHYSTGQYEARGLACKRCPAGSVRLNQNTTECVCQPEFLSDFEEDLLMKCSRCPMNSEKVFPDDRMCTCLGDTLSLSGGNQTTSDWCSKFNIYIQDCLGYSLLSCYSASLEGLNFNCNKFVEVSL